tara:strand:- start:599 stop:2032 length:1434 start_codon:yes stop_codon:yes gene_type:complete
MATIPSTTVDIAGAEILTSPQKYAAIGDLLNAAASGVNEVGKPDVSDLLVETYGDQGITGFLKMTGAITAAGSSDQVEFYEVGRRHKTLAYTSGIAVASNELNLPAANLSYVTGASGSVSTPTGAVLEKGDIVMDSVTGVRLIVKDFGVTAGSDYTLIRLDGENCSGTVEVDTSNGGTFIHIGNMYEQGSDQPTNFIQPDVIRRINSYAIVKDRFEVAGSQATNVGYVNIGNGDYRWFMYGEMEARKRFMDKREMTLLFGELNDGANDQGIAGSEGYITALESRGINITNANSNPMDSFSEFDDLIIQLDKQGAPAEYAMYLNRKQDLAIDDMLAGGIATGVTAGLPGQFGAFNNDSDMAVKLGFKSFTRAGYTFHKHDWKLLNDPTLVGASNKFQGVMVPLANVADARSGMKSPALEMKFKAANGYSREMEHWVTGGGVLGHTNNGDTGKDVATFHYRSEVCLLTRAANQHVLLKG